MKSKAKEKAVEHFYRFAIPFDGKGDSDMELRKAIDIAIQETKKEMIAKIEEYKNTKEERKNKLEEGSLRGKLGKEHEKIVIEIDAINELKKELGAKDGM